LEQIENQGYFLNVAGGATGHCRAAPGQTQTKSDDDAMLVLAA